MEDTDSLNPVPKPIYNYKDPIHTKEVIQNYTVGACLNVFRLGTYISTINYKQSSTIEMFKKAGINLELPKPIDYVKAFPKSIVCFVTPFAVRDQFRLKLGMERYAQKEDKFWTCFHAGGRAGFVTAIASFPFDYLYANRMRSAGLLTPECYALLSKESSVENFRSPITLFGASFKLLGPRMALFYYSYGMTFGIYDWLSTATSYHESELWKWFSGAIAGNMGSKMLGGFGAFYQMVCYTYDSRRNLTDKYGKGWWRKKENFENINEIFKPSESLFKKLGLDPECKESRSKLTKKLNKLGGAQYSRLTGFQIWVIDYLCRHNFGKKDLK
jgi:hypothetical protein